MFNVTNNEYQAKSTAKVTRIGCCFQFAYLDSFVYRLYFFQLLLERCYLHNRAAAATKAMRRSHTNMELAILALC